jgi:hypothetical protein
MIKKKDYFKIFLSNKVGKNKKIWSLFKLKLYKSVVKIKTQRNTKKILFAKIVSLAAIGEINKSEKLLKKHLNRFFFKKKNL